MSGMDFFLGVTPPEDIRQRIVRFQTTFSNKVVAEPHITIKAQSGLTADRAWLKPVEICLRQQSPFRAHAQARHSDVNPIPVDTKYPPPRNRT
jgi:hypothetical protein